MFDPTDAYRRVPTSWRPPMPFPVVVRYWDERRRPDVLWTVPWFVDADGRVVEYRAFGPAGTPVGGHLVSLIEFRGLPRGARFKMGLERNRAGQVVFAAAPHTPN